MKQGGSARQQIVAGVSEHRHSKRKADDDDLAGVQQTRWYRLQAAGEDERRCEEQRRADNRSRNGGNYGSRRRYQREQRESDGDHIGERAAGDSGRRRQTDAWTVAVDSHATDHSGNDRSDAVAAQPSS